MLGSIGVEEYSRVLPVVNAIGYHFVVAVELCGCAKRTVGQRIDRQLHECGISKVQKTLDTDWASSKEI